MKELEITGGEFYQSGTRLGEVKCVWPLDGKADTFLVAQVGEDVCFVASRALSVAIGEVPKFSDGAILSKNMQKYRSGYIMFGIAIHVSCC